MPALVLSALAGATDQDSRPLPETSETSPAPSTPMTGGPANGAPLKPWGTGHNLLMIAPAFFTIMSAPVLGPVALILGCIATICAAMFGASYAAEHQGGHWSAPGAFLGICFLNAILMFGGCMFVFGSMSR